MRFSLVKPSHGNLRIFVSLARWLTSYRKIYRMAPFSANGSPGHDWVSMLVFLHVIPSVFHLYTTLEQCTPPHNCTSCTFSMFPPLWVMRKSHTHVTLRQQCSTCTPWCDVTPRRSHASHWCYTNITNTLHGRPQYEPYEHLGLYAGYKKQHSITGALLILVAIMLTHLTTHLTYRFSWTIFLPNLIFPQGRWTPNWNIKTLLTTRLTLTQSQMLKDPDVMKFLASKCKEIHGLQKLEVFDVKHVSTKPPNAHLLSSTWIYQRKHSPAGHILKYKSRLCVDGSQQEHGRDYWDVYAPVVSWPIICFLLLLSSILDLKQCHDYT